MAKKYKSACSSLRPGQLDRLMSKIKDTPENKKEKIMTKTSSQNWIFTWGYGQAFPNKYIKIFGTYSSARTEMFKRFGSKWSFQYPEKKEQELIKHKMKELK